MKHASTILTVLAVLVIGSFSSRAQDKKISIFCDHIETIASQEGLSFAEAAARVRDMGYTGVDVRVTLSPDKLRILDALGFAHACAIVDISYAEGGQRKAEKAALAFAKDNGYDRLLLVPGLLPEDASAATVSAVRRRIAAFARKAASRGVNVLVEDFDNPRSVCYNTADLDTLLTASRELSLAFDTGNFLVAGEDCFVVVNHFFPRIGHVHLKNRVSGQDFTCTPVGGGCLPLTGIIKRLDMLGYTGWYTVEQFGSAQMLSDAENSCNRVISALEGTKMRPKMTEYYYPEVPVVDASAYRPSDVLPSGARILLGDGKGLGEWKSAKGGDARWTLNPDGSMTVVKKEGDLLTREEFGSYHLHVEWCVPADVTGEGQSRGNSGIYLNNAYEVQVLDSYHNPTYVDGQAASIYKQYPPLANPCNAPGVWNYYDISFTAPVLDADGTLLSRPRVTVVFNGVVVQDDVEILGTTEYVGFPKPVWAERGPILLQSHGDPSAPISFRNIWILER